MKYRVCVQTDKNTRDWYFDTLETALKIYNKCKQVFGAESITANLAVWNNDGWLIESETVNPTRVIKIN